eukprot:696870-Pyramimonas_sp.AAC.1
MLYALVACERAYSPAPGARRGLAALPAADPAAAPRPAAAAPERGPAHGSPGEGGPPPPPCV